jgi:hypothetical protein
VRNERERPGELVHMEVKKVGRISEGGVWRPHGRGPASVTPNRTTTVGYDYVRSLVDDHSRLAYREIAEGEIGTTCADLAPNRSSSRRTALAERKGGTPEPHPAEQ